MPFGHCRDPIVDAARALSGAGTTQGPQHGLPDGLDWVSIQVNLTAITGTGATLDLTVQWSMDGGTTWADADASATDAFTQFTLAGGAKAVVKRFNKKAPLWRFKEVLAGTTPTANYTVTYEYR